MQILRFDWLRILAVFLTLASMTASQIAAQDADPEEVKEKSIVDRFTVVLEKNPRRGTALDKVYGFHVERGSLPALISTYREKAKASKGTETGSAWMIVGLLESLRGQDAVAAAAFEQAEKLATDHSLASYYLGQSLILVGQPDKAAEALERSIERKPNQADLLEIFQALGRVYQRAQKSAQALEVWNRLEKQFPNDVRVQEQIATTLLEENEFAAALPRYESLVKSTKDKYRQSLFQMESAEIKIRLGRTDEAIKEFESLLNQLLPENWLYREVRRRIEAVYLKTDDQAGLIAYYESWLKKSPKDLDAMTRLSRLLAGYGRAAESQTWLARGLMIAPTKKELRQALISQYLSDHKHADAIVQYELLDKYEPNNPDTLREWGRQILKDRSRDEAVRKTEAAAVWRRWIDARPNDALVVSQVGELFRKADLFDEALELYQKAISLAPDQGQYREYLGEYFHSLKRKEEALTTWRAIADGKQRTSPNLARLAEVLANFAYLPEAVETHAEACQLDPKDFSLQVKHVDLLARAEKHDAALQHLAVVKKLATNEDEHEAWLSRELRELQALDQLKERIAEVSKQIDRAGAEEWFWLARAYEAQRLLKEAAYAVTKAGTLAPQSIPILKASARIHEAQNNWLAAVEVNSRLAAIDRRYRTEYLKQIATLEQRLGRRDKAIQAGRDLIAAAPGNPEVFEFFSQLCFQLGEVDEGLAALRRSVRVNPAEIKGMLLLAAALTEQFKTSEAIELYWRAFEKSANLDDRLRIVPQLTELYLQTNQLDRMLERLERQRREVNQQREMTICIAQAYQSIGDDGNARHELEKLLTEDTRDTQLLAQLVKLCESDGDLEAAIKFQQQVLKLAPDKESTMRLAQLLTKAGEPEEAAALLKGATVPENEPEVGFKALDELLTQAKYERALEMAEKLTAEEPGNWEAIYREGVALAHLTDRSVDAAKRFEAILAMKLNDDDLSPAAKATPQNPPASSSKIAMGITAVSHIRTRIQLSGRIRQAVGLLQGAGVIRGGRVGTNSAPGPGIRTTLGSSGVSQAAFWAPTEFGVVRMASLGWLEMLGRKHNDIMKSLDERRVRASQSDNLRELIDWYYLGLVSVRSGELNSALHRLSLQPDADIEFKALYLTSLNSVRTFTVANATGGVVVRQTIENPNSPPNLRVLDPKEMEHVLACFRALGEDAALTARGASCFHAVIGELTNAGRKDEADQMFANVLAKAKQPNQLEPLLASIVMRNDLTIPFKILDRMEELRQSSPTTNSTTPIASTSFAGSATFLFPLNIIDQLVRNRSQRKAIDDLLLIWDRSVPVIAAQSAPLSNSSGSRRRSRTPSTTARQPSLILISQGGAIRSEPLEFPLENDVYSLAAIQILRQTFVMFQEADRTTDFVTHFKQKLTDEKIPANNRPVWQLGLGYVLWWLDDKDAAIAVLKDATDAASDNQELKFELARMYEKIGQTDKALQLLDSLPPTDQQAMQQREITALRLAVNTGNINRARTAAERLFGLRLDLNLQIQLAQQMHQLGMHEQAEALLVRAQRQAGNKTDVLMTLMQQYQAQGKNDVATQIAYQLLRRSGNEAGLPTVVNSGNFVTTTTRRRAGFGDGGARQLALSVLQRSGKLPDMIKKLESQLEHAPNSQRLLTTLIEYASANGDEKKVAELTARIVDKKRDDPQFRFNIAQQLMQQGKHKDAIEHFQAAFAKDPLILRNQYSQIIRSYQSAGQMKEMASLLESIDLKANPDNYVAIQYFLQSSNDDEKLKDVTISLFRKAWKEVPENRRQQLVRLNNEAIWQMPEIYEYAHEVVFPSGPASGTPGGFPGGFSQARSNSWPGFGQLLFKNSASIGEVKIVTFVGRFLNLAETNHKLDELSHEIKEAQEKNSDWDAGPALLALVELRQGKINDARQRLEAVLPGIRGIAININVPWEIAQELMEHQSCEELAMQYLEVACKNRQSSTNNFRFTPSSQLLALYQKHGRKDDARRLVYAVSRPTASTTRGNEDYEAYQRVQNCLTLANELTKLGYHADVIRIYQEQLARPEDFLAYRRMYGVTTGISEVDRVRSQIEKNLSTALKNVRPEMIPELLGGMEFGKGGTAPQSALEPANAIGEPLNMMLVIESRDLESTSVSSALDGLVSHLSVQAEVHAATKSALAELRARRPDDVGVRILTVQLAINDKDADATSLGIKNLVELMDATPLEPLPTKSGLTPAQLRAAMDQAGLWLVARNCLRQESTRAGGTRLAERALEAARRLNDKGYALAILREWGQIALDTGDKATGERCWTEMLQSVLPQRADPTQK